MITLFHIFGIMTVCCWIAAAMVYSEIPVTALIDPVSLMFVGGGTPSLLMLSCTPAEWSSASSVCIGRITLLDTGQRYAALHWFRSASRAAIASGVLGMIFGVIGALVSMDDPTTLGFYLAVTLISLLYAILLSEIVFYPLACTVAASLPTHLPSEPTRGRNG